MGLLSSLFGGGNDYPPMEPEEDESVEEYDCFPDLVDPDIYHAHPKHARPQPDYPPMEPTEDEEPRGFWGRLFG